MKFVAAWLGATLVAVIVAAAAVGSVRSEVTDEPTALGSPEVAALAVDVPAPQASDSAPAVTVPIVDVITTGTQAEPVPVTTTTTPATTTTTAAVTDSAPSTSNTTTTTRPSSTTTTQPSTTTTQPSESYSKTYDTVGGSVRVVVEGTTISFGGAVPTTGWSVELKNPGPDEVKVEFDKNEGDGEVEFSAKIENGELQVEISQEDHDD